MDAPTPIVEAESREIADEVIDPFLDVAKAAHDEGYQNGFADAKWDSDEVYDREALTEDLDGEMLRDSWYEGVLYAAQDGLKPLLLAPSPATGGVETGEPMAWRYRWKIGGEWVSWRVAEVSQFSRHLPSLEEYPLYASPPPIAGPTKEEVAAVLKPFAEVADKAKGSDDACWCGQDGAVIRYRDLRLAARLTNREGQDNA